MFQPGMRGASSPAITVQLFFAQCLAVRPAFFKLAFFAPGGCPWVPGPRPPARKADAARQAVHAAPGILHAVPLPHVLHHQPRRPHAVSEPALPRARDQVVPGPRRLAGTGPAPGPVPPFVAHAARSVPHCPHQPVSYGRVRPVERPLNPAYGGAFLPHHKHEQPGLGLLVFLRPAQSFQPFPWDAGKEVVSFWHGFVPLHALYTGMVEFRSAGCGTMPLIPRPSRILRPKMAVRDSDIVVQEAVWGPGGRPQAGQHHAGDQLQGQRLQQHAAHATGGNGHGMSAHSGRPGEGLRGGVMTLTTPATPADR